MKQNMANNKHNKQIDFKFGKRTSFRSHRHSHRHSIMSMQKSRRKSITLEYCSHPCAECCKELMMFGSEHNTNNLITSHSGTIRNLHPANNFPHSQRLFSYFHLDYPRSELWAPSGEENIFALLMCFCTWPPLDKVAEILYAMGKG